MIERNIVAGVAIGRRLEDAMWKSLVSGADPRPSKLLRRWKPWLDREWKARQATKDRP